MIIVNRNGKEERIEEIEAYKQIFELNLDKKRIGRYRSNGDLETIKNFKRFDCKFYTTELYPNEIKLLLYRSKKNIRADFWKMYMFFKSVTSNGKWGILIRKDEIQGYTKINHQSFYNIINYLMKDEIIDIYRIKEKITKYPKNIYYFNLKKVYKLKKFENAFVILGQLTKKEKRNMPYIGRITSIKYEK